METTRKDGCLPAVAAGRVRPCPPIIANRLAVDQPPSEIDDHYGVTMALIGVGVAPDGYAQTPAAQSGLDWIRKYLQENPPANSSRSTIGWLCR